MGQGLGTTLAAPQCVAVPLPTACEGPGAQAPCHAPPCKCMCVAESRNETCVFKLASSVFVMELQNDTRTDEDRNFLEGSSADSRSGGIAFCLISLLAIQGFGFGVFSPPFLQCCVLLPKTGCEAASWHLGGQGL